MPPIRYERLPYAGPPRYVPSYRNLGELIGLQTQNQTNLAMTQAQIAAQKWQALGQMFDRFVQGRKAQKAAESQAAIRAQERRAAEQLKRDEMTERKAEREATNKRLGLAEERATRAEQRSAALDAVETTMPGPIDPAAAATLRQYPGTAPLVADQTTLDARPHIGTMAPPSQYAVRGQTPREVQQAQAAAAARAAAEAAASDREADNARMAAAQREAARHNAAMERAASTRPQTPRAPIWVIGPNGEFQDLAGVAPPGSKPASNREQGRAVVSGDANRVADLDTSLDDLVALASTLQETKDATGPGAQIGAALPNAVTNLTGWGRDPKIRQGVIDRVKQVIGKALEGGVLRKEDEIKYAKILPTIGDDPAVAASKLVGLREAIVMRRQTLLDSLADAGYDTSKYNARTQVATVPDLSGLPANTARTFRGGPFAGQEWAIVNGQPTRIK